MTHYLMISVLKLSSVWVYIKSYYTVWFWLCKNKYRNTWWRIGFINLTLPFQSSCDRFQYVKFWLLWTFFATFYLTVPIATHANDTRHLWTPLMKRFSHVLSIARSSETNHVVVDAASWFYSFNDLLCMETVYCWSVLTISQSYHSQFCGSDHFSFKVMRHFLWSSEVFWRSFIFDHFLMTSSLCSGVAQYCSSLTLIRDLRHISPRDSCLIALSSLQSCLVTLPSFLLDEVFICHSDKFGDLAVICSSCTFHVLFRRASWTFIPLLSLGK